MAAAKVTNTFTAKGRIYDLGTGTIILHIRPDRNGGPRTRRREGGDTRPPAAQPAEAALAALAGTGPAAEVTETASAVITQTKDADQRARAATVTPRRRRQREEPDGILPSIILGRYEGPMDLRWNDEVEVTGHVVARSGYSRVWDRYTYQQDLVADRITYSKTRIEEMTGVKAGFYTGPDHFQACFSGKVKEVKDESGWVNLTIEVKRQGERPSEIRVQFSKNARVGRLGAEKGDEVFVVTSLTTRTKEVGGEIRRFANFHVEDLHIIEKAASAGDAEREAEEMFAALDDDFEDAEEAAGAAPPPDDGGDAARG